MTSVDARGTRCPMPVIMAARAATELAEGDLLIVLADDPAAATDLPAWGRMRGHRVSGVDHGDHTAYQVVIGGASAAR